jgi:hypothetical protein
MIVDSLGSSDEFLLYLAVEIRILFVIQSLCFDTWRTFLRVKLGRIFEPMEVFCLQREWGSKLSL